MYVCVCAFKCTRVCVCVKGSEFGQVRVQQSKSLVALETGRGVLREGSGGEDLMLEKERESPSLRMRPDLAYAWKKRRLRQM